MDHKEVLFDLTGTGEMICICENCSCKTPHFSWYPRSGDPIYLQLEKAMPLEHCVEMDLKNRQHLQKYLTFVHWHKLVNAWNAGNCIQVSPLLHVPRYIDLMTCKMECCRYSVMQKDNCLGTIFLDMDEEDERPHFHYRRQNGTEEMIALTGALYMEPVTAELSKTEKTALISTLRSSSGTESETVYESMCTLWDLFFQSDFFDTTDEGDLFPMPDYMKLKKKGNNHEPS